MDGQGKIMLGGRYELLRQVKASAGDRRIEIGQRGRCRFCGRDDRRLFRKVAHTFPEALGNKWVVSLDECDDCNAKFSVYEDALAKAVSPFLTLGGVRGKGNRVRQTGRSNGRAVLAHHNGEERRRLSIIARNADPADHVRIDPASGCLTLAIPVAGVPFTPRHAYKALTKMAVGLLPDEELDHYEQLRCWLLEAHDSVDFPRLEVAASFGSVGNAPPVVVGTLLRRRAPSDFVPHMLFIFCAGSVCLQIDLLSDHLEDHIPPLPPGCIKILWSNVLDPPGQPRLTIEYGEPVHLNWAGTTTVPQPVKAMVLDFDPATSRGHLTPVPRRDEQLRL